MTTIGPFTNVPEPGADLESAWAQQLTQYVVDGPRGYVASTTQGAGDWTAPTTGWTDVPAMAITLTPGIDRTYRFTYMGTINISTSTPVAGVGIHDGTTQWVMQETYTSVTGASIPFCIVVSRKFTAATPITFRPQVYANGNTVKLMGTGFRNARFLIEDIGKV